MIGSLEKVIQAFTAERVAYLVIGGWTAVIHGSARVTVDKDLEAIAELQALFEERRRTEQEKREVSGTTTPENS
jgi:acetyl-CoA carboxylase carboxyltransferase component